MLAATAQDRAMLEREKENLHAALAQAEPSRFDLIEQLIGINTAVTQLAIAPAALQGGPADQESILAAAYQVGFDWATYEPQGTAFRLPELLVDLQEHAPDSIAGEVFDWFYNGYRDSHYRVCVFPQPRTRDDRPSLVCGENLHFWMARQNGGFLIGSNNLSGGFGSAWLPPAALSSTLQTLTQGNIQSAKGWYLDDPYGMAKTSKAFFPSD